LYSSTGSDFLAAFFYGIRIRLNHIYIKLSNSINLLSSKNQNLEHHYLTLFGGFDDTALDDVEE